MKKIIFLIYSGSLFALDGTWQDFENNLYIGGGYSINNALINQFGSSSTNSNTIDVGVTALFENNIYVNINGFGNLLANSQFIHDWYSLTTKIGYSLNNSYINFTPYALFGMGNQGAYYSNSFNYTYGVGVLSEAMITDKFAVFADINYALQGFGNNIGADFNKNILNNYANYSLIDTPISYGATFGLKYITQDGYYISPFFNYQYYQQSFQSQGNISYGELNPSTSQYQFGVNIGWML